MVETTENLPDIGRSVKRKEVDPVGTQEAHGSKEKNINFRREALMNWHWRRLSHSPASHNESLKLELPRA